MPNQKSKEQAKTLKRTLAQKRDLAEMRMRLPADLVEMRMRLQADAKGKPPPELPRASVRLRKSLKNRTNL
jgi:hypothetical protein